MSQSNLQTEITGATEDKWPVKVRPCGHGQWAFVAGPRSGAGYQSKQAAQEAGEAARLAAIARASARAADQARARWAAEYREARKVRNFERALLPGGVSSLGMVAPFSAYIATMHHGDGLAFGHMCGVTPAQRYIAGPRGVLPA